MVWKDYELTPSNRVLEQRDRLNPYWQTYGVVSGFDGYYTKFLYYGLVTGVFYYFGKKFYTPGNVKGSILGLLSAGLMSYLVGRKFSHTCLYMVGDPNEY